MDPENCKWVFDVVYVQYPVHLTCDAILPEACLHGAAAVTRDEAALNERVRERNTISGVGYRDPLTHLSPVTNPIKAPELTAGVVGQSVDG